MSEAPRDKLNRLTEKLFDLVDSEDTGPDELAEAHEGLLPSLCDALIENGYGIRYFKIYNAKRHGWLAPDGTSMRQHRNEAGRFEEDEAVTIAEEMNADDEGGQPTISLVPLAADEPYRR